MRGRLAWLLTIAAGVAAPAQTIPPARLAIVQAESRGGASARDLSIIRAGVGSGDAQTARIAVRALGRLQRPALVADLLPALRHALPELRAEAANAIAQAAQGLDQEPKSTTTAAAAALIARLKIEADASVRAALCESMARLPYRTAADVERAEAALLEASANTGITDRLGVAKGFEALIRLHAALHPPSPRVLEYLNAAVVNDEPRSDAEAMRDARVRRLALASLVAVRAASDATLDRAAADPDPQVRRLAMAAIGGGGLTAALAINGLADPAPMVRAAALEAVFLRGAPDACAAAARAARDTVVSVACRAIDRLATCPAADGVAVLEKIATDPSAEGTPRASRRSAHALVALAAAAPERAAPLVTQFAQSASPERRSAAKRASTTIARGSREPAGAHDDDRVAATAQAAARGPQPASRTTSVVPVDAAELRRFAAPRARVTIRDVGRLDIALFTSEAPVAVLQFVRRAQAGEFDGARFVPSELGLVVGAQEPVTDERPAGEVGLWPHVRGAIGVANAAGATPGFTIDTVDTPALDHRSAVFGQILNGLDLLDDVVEGDVIESIAIVP